MKLVTLMTPHSSASLSCSMSPSPITLVHPLILSCCSWRHEPVMSPPNTFRVNLFTAPINPSAVVIDYTDYWCHPSFWSRVRLCFSVRACVHVGAWTCLWDNCQCPIGTRNTVWVISLVRARTFFFPAFRQTQNTSKQLCACVKPKHFMADAKHNVFRPLWRMRTPIRSLHCFINLYFFFSWIAHFYLSFISLIVVINYLPVF